MMSAFWIGLIVLVALCALLAVVYPLLGTPEQWMLAEERRALEKLATDKERTLRLLKDLDEQGQAAALGAADYAALRRKYLEEAALIQRRLDALRAGRERGTDV